MEQENKIEKHTNLTHVKLNQMISLVASKNTLFILKGKIASSTVTRALNRTHSLDLNVDFNNLKNYSLFGENTRDKLNTHELRALKYYDAFVENSLPTDVRVVTFIRNPLERFFSGFFQDFFKETVDIENRLLRLFIKDYLVSKSGILSSDIDRFMISLRETNDKIDVKEVNVPLYHEKNMVIWDVLINFSFKAFLESDNIYRYTHTDPYMSFVYKLINKFEDTLNIYDIDEIHLYTILKKYTDENELNPKYQTFKENQTVGDINDIFIKMYGENRYIRQKVNDILYDEMRLYKEITLIQKEKKNERSEKDFNNISTEDR